MSTVTTGSVAPKTEPPTRCSRGRIRGAIASTGRRGRWQRPGELADRLDQLATLHALRVDRLARMIDGLTDAFECVGERLVAVVELGLEAAHRVDQGDLRLATAFELGVDPNLDGRGELRQRGSHLGIHPFLALAPHTPPARTARGHSLAVITDPRTSKDRPRARPVRGAERPCGRARVVERWRDADRVPRDGRHERRLRDEPAVGRQLRPGVHGPTRAHARGARLGPRAHRLRVGHARSRASRGADRAEDRDAAGPARAPPEPLDPDVRGQDLRDARPALGRSLRRALHHRRQRPRTATGGRLPAPRRALRPHPRVHPDREAGLVRTGAVRSLGHLLPVLRLRGGRVPGCRRPAR